MLSYCLNTSTLKKIPEKAYGPGGPSGRPRARPFWLPRSVPVQSPRKGAVGGGGDPANHGYAQVPGSGAPGAQVGCPGADP